MSFLAAPLLMRAQGVSSREVKAQPRGKPSGVPFLSHFTDVAQQAGLTAPTIYGGIDKKNYILEISRLRRRFPRLRQRRLAGYLRPVRNAAGGRAARRDEPAVQEQPRRHVHRRDGESRAGATGWASAVTVGDYDNDGFDDLFITYWGENVLYHNNGDGTFTDVTEKAGLLQTAIAGAPAALSSTTTATGIWICLSRTTWTSILERCRSPGENANCNWKGIPVNCGPRGLPPGTCTCTTTTATALSPTSAKPRESPKRRQLTP